LFRCLQPLFRDACFKKVGFNQLPQF
jgi:hypothetical protein